MPSTAKVRTCSFSDDTVSAVSSRWLHRRRHRPGRQAHGPCRRADQRRRGHCGRKTRHHGRVRLHHHKESCGDGQIVEGVAEIIRRALGGGRPACGFGRASYATRERVGVRAVAVGITRRQRLPPSSSQSGDPARSTHAPHQTKSATPRLWISGYAEDARCCDLHRNESLVPIHSHSRLNIVDTFKARLTNRIPLENVCNARCRV